MVSNWKVLLCVSEESLRTVPPNAKVMTKKCVKIQRMYGNFFPNLSSIIPEKCVVTPVFFLDSDSPC